MTRLERDLAALATMTPVQLRARWLEGTGQAGSMALPALLRHLLAQRLQEKRYGALPVMVARELERVALTNGNSLPEDTRRAAPLSVGTRLIREWNGQTIAVEVSASGFVWNERSYRSLSEIARQVTGAHWSGPRFFGLHRHG